MDINKRLSDALIRLDNMSEEEFMEDLIKFGYQPPITKIIFLDIDGVLNNASDSDMHCHLDKSCDFYSKVCVDHLNTITDKTGAKIVVSSTWRLKTPLQELKDKLLYMGVKGEVIGVTDDLRHHHCLRGNEIHNWIQDNKELVNCEYYNYKSYVILDDDSDMLLWQKENFVHTNGEVGLDLGGVEKAIKILNGEEKDEH